MCITFCPQVPRSGLQNPPSKSLTFSSSTGWLYDGFGSYKVAFYLSGSVAIFSLVLVFFVVFLLRHREPRNEFDGRRSVSLTDSNKPDTKKDFGHPESSGYSSSRSGSEEYESQPLLYKGEFVGSKENYLTGKKLRQLFFELERETVL